MDSNIIQWNCRGLFNKRYNLKFLISIIKQFFICLQETFYLNDQEISELENLFSEYKIYIKNRPKVGANNPGGEVGIMVYQPTPHQILNLYTELEAIAVNYKYNNKTIEINLQNCKNNLSFITILFSLAGYKLSRTLF